MDVDGLVGMDTYAAATRTNGRCREGTHGIITLEGDVARLTHHFGECTYDVLMAVGTWVLCNLMDTGGTKFHLSGFSCALYADLRTTNDDRRASFEEVAATVHIAYDNFWGREHQPLGITDIASFLDLCRDVELHLLYVGLALADLGQVFLHTVCKV